MQHLFYHFRERVFDKPVLGIRRNHDHVTTKIRYSFNQKRPFIPSLHELYVFRVGKTILLSCCACADAVAYMHSLVKTLFQGESIIQRHSGSWCCTYLTFMNTDFHTQERSDGLEQEPPPLLINVVVSQQYEDEGTQYHHEFLRVALKDDEKCTLDVSGNQYGRYTSVMP